MQISCPQCQAQYNVDDARIPPQGASIRCPRCQHTFTTKPAADAVPLPGMKPPAAVPLPGQAVPLPGQAVPLPGQAVPWPGQAVPLPGQAVPLPGQAVPLPGQAVPLPGQAVPLPGQAVPLPGQAVPLPGQVAPLPGQAVPLPGQAVPLPGQAVPLPGQAVPLPGQSFAQPISFPSAAPAPMAPSTGLTMADVFGGADLPPSQPDEAPVAAMPSFGGQALSMNDIFGDASAAPSEAKNPFHGTNSVITGPGSDNLMGFIDGAGQASAAPQVDLYQIRKRAGRVLGPFEAHTVLDMFQRGELLGSEEASIDAVTWKPLAQFPAFASTIQSAMANALSGLENLPTPARPGHADLPVPRPPSVERAPTPSAPSVVADVNTDALRQAADKKALVEKKRALGAFRHAKWMAAGGAAVVVIGVGVAMNFVTEYGYFGYRLLAPAEPAVVVVKPPKAEQPPPPPALPETQQSDDALFAADTFASYRIGVEQAARAERTATTPEAKAAAVALRAHYLAYLVALEDEGALVKDLQADYAGLKADSLEKWLADAAFALADKQWDKGVAALQPAVAADRPAAARAELQIMLGLLLEGKGDRKGAAARYDDALQANTHRKLPLYLMARQAAAAGEADAAQAFAEKVLAEPGLHPRAQLLLASLLAGDAKNAARVGELVAVVAEGAGKALASPAQLAEAHRIAAIAAIAQKDNKRAVAALQASVDAVPGNRQVRVAAAQTAFQMYEFGLARKLAQQILEMDAKDVEGAVLLARAKLGSRDTLSAYTDLIALQKAAPDNALVNAWLGAAARDMAKMDESRTYLEKAQKLDPKMAMPTLELMQDLAERGKLDDALASANAVEEQVSADDRPALRTRKAAVLTRMRQLSAARTEVAAAQAARPNDASVLAQQAFLLLAERQFNEADAAAQAGSKLDPQNIDVLIARGDVAMARDNAKAALLHYEAALLLAPTTIAPYVRATFAAADLGDAKRAQGFAETAAMLRPGVPDVVAAQGYALKPTDAKAGARLVQQAMELSPKDPQWPMRLAQMYQAQGALLEALDAAKKAESLDGEYLDAVYMVGKVNRELGRSADAKTAYNRCVTLDPKRVTCWVELADMLAAINNDVEALKAYEKAVVADPTNPITTCAMGETLVLRMGDMPKQLKRGAELLDKCTKLSPKHATAWKNLGNAYRTMFKKKEAIAAYQTHLKTNPHDEEASLITDILEELTGNKAP